MIAALILWMALQQSQRLMFIKENWALVCIGYTGKNCEFSYETFAQADKEPGWRTQVEMCNYRLANNENPDHLRRAHEFCAAMWNSTILNTASKSSFKAVLCMNNGVEVPCEAKKTAKKRTPSDICATDSRAEPCTYQRVPVSEKQTCDTIVVPDESNGGTKAIRLKIPIPCPGAENARAIPGAIIYRNSATKQFMISLDDGKSFAPLEDVIALSEGAGKQKPSGQTKKDTCVEGELIAVEGSTSICSTEKQQSAPVPCEELVEEWKGNMDQFKAKYKDGFEFKLGPGNACIILPKRKPASKSTGGYVAPKNSPMSFVVADPSNPCGLGTPETEDKGKLAACAVQLLKEMPNGPKEPSPLTDEFGDPCVIEFAGGHCVPLSKYKAEPVDVRAIQETREEEYGDNNWCNSCLEGSCTAMACDPHVKRKITNWTCADKNRGLWHDENDPPKWWCRKAQP